jgi:hypothetical protein
MVQIPILASAIGFYHSVLSKKGVDMMYGNDGGANGIVINNTDDGDGVLRDNGAYDPVFSDGGFESDNYNETDIMNADDDLIMDGDGGMVPFFNGGDDRLIIPLDIQLDPCTLAKIYTGTIQYWDNDEIVANNQNNDNVDKKLPHIPIKVVALKDDSSTTLAVTKVRYITKKKKDTRAKERSKENERRDICLDCNKKIRTRSVSSVFSFFLLPFSSIFIFVLSSFTYYYYYYYCYYSFFFGII